MGRVTQSDIAARAGVSSFTVSCALRGQACVAPETARRICEIAEKMGYRPNAAARLLAHSRTRPRADLRQLAIAVVTFGNEPLVPAGTRYPRLKDLARREGFSLQIVRVRDFNSPAEMSRILWARGVEGLVLLTREAPPALRLRDMEGFEWDRFSLVKISRGFDELKCHTVALNVFFLTHLVLERVIAAGYRRLLVVLVSITASHEDDWMRRGAIEAFRKLRARDFEKMEILTTPTFGPSVPPELTAKINEMKPDIVIGFPFAWRFRLEEKGYRMPDDFAFVGLLVEGGSVGERDRPTSGPLSDFCEQEFPVALQILKEEMAAGRKGIPRIQLEHSVSIEWQQGVTMPIPAVRKVRAARPSAR